MTNERASQGSGAPSAHTPGPWTVEVSGEQIGVDGARGPGYISIQAGADTIATVSHKDGSEPYRPALANAHLIAAAPTMLRVLGFFTDVGDGKCIACGGAVSTEGYCACPPNARRIAARAAIRAATERSEAS